MGTYGVLCYISCDAQKEKFNIRMRAPLVPSHIVAEHVCLEGGWFAKNYANLPSDLFLLM